jgi:hypothetical protein
MSAMTEISREQILAMAMQVAAADARGDLVSFSRRETLALVALRQEAFDRGFRTVAQIVEDASAVPHAALNGSGEYSGVSEGREMDPEAS